MPKQQKKTQKNQKPANWDREMVCRNCNQQGKRGHYTRARARRQVCTLPNPEELGTDIEEGAVNQRPLQALLLLPRGGAGPATAPAPSSYRYYYVGKLAN